MMYAMFLIDNMINSQVNGYTYCHISLAITGLKIEDKDRIWEAYQSSL